MYPLLHFCYSTGVHRSLMVIGHHRPPLQEDLHLSDNSQLAKNPRIAETTQLPKGRFAEGCLPGVPHIPVRLHHQGVLRH